MYLVSQVDVTLQGERELPLGQIALVNVSGSQPATIGLVREQASVINGQKVTQHFWTIFAHVASTFSLAFLRHLDSDVKSENENQNSKSKFEMLSKCVCFCVFGAVT